MMQIKLTQIIQILFITLILFGAFNGHCALSPYSPSSSEAQGDSPWRVSGSIGEAENIGFGVARLTLTRMDGPFSGSRSNLTVATSLAIPPLLGMSVSRLITGNSTYFRANFWPNLVGAYAGAGLTMGSLAILLRATRQNNTSGAFPESTTAPESASRAAALVALLQVLLPMALPSLGATAGFFLRRLPRPDDTEVSFLSPTLFLSPSPSRDKKYILGVQLVSARF